MIDVMILTSIINLLFVLIGYFMALVLNGDSTKVKEKFKLSSVVKEKDEEVFIPED